MKRAFRAFVIGCLFPAGYVNAADVVRTTEIIASCPIQGVTFSMSPRQAFEHLYSLGYRAGNIGSFDEWDTDGIEFVRGSYAGPEGESRVTFSRKDGRITGIAESWNRPRDHFSAPEVIERLRQHFGIAGEEPTCRAVAEKSGNCRVVDAGDPHDVKLAFGLQVLPGMLIRYVEDKKAYAQP